MVSVNMIRKIAVLSLVIFLAVSACIPKEATAEPTNVVSAIHTEAAKTVVASIPTATETSRPTMTLEPSITPMASFTPNASSLLTPIAVGGSSGDVYCDDLTFLKNVTVNPGDVIIPGKNFDSTWKVQNAGSCEWQPGYKLVYILGDRMGGGTAVVKNMVGVGGIISLSINLTAPGKPGTYTGYWRMVNLRGASFGDPVSVSITVPKPTATPTSIATIRLLTTHTVVLSDRCEGLESTYDTTREYIKSLNPGVNKLCSKLEDGSLVGVVLTVPQPLP
jgi:LysM repeat protein